MVVMSEQEISELRLKQAELIVLKQILTGYEQAKKTDLYLEPDPLKSILDKSFTTQNAISQQVGLERLEKKGLIRLVDSNSLRGIHIYIVAPGLLKKLYADLYESIPSSGTIARIIYSTKTGRGKINGKPFKLNRGRNRKVFHYLAKRPKKYITKEKLWVVANEKGKFDENDPDNVIQFNTVITTLREALKHISPEHLRLKKRVILYAEVTLTD